MSVARPVRRMASFGGRLPPVIGGLILLTLVLSIVGAVGSRNGLPLVTYGVLVPERVLRGELWRLVTWIFLELDPISLLFGCLGLYWFGRDLAMTWGSVRFLRIFFGLTLATGVVLTAVARLVWPALLRAPYAGNWPVVTGLVLMWALAFPDREMFFYFILRLGGMRLVYVTLGVTALFALYYGVPAVVHVILAEGFALLYMYRFVIRKRLGALLRRDASRKPPRRRPPPGQFTVWDEEKGEFRPPRWKN